MCTRNPKFLSRSAPNISPVMVHAQDLFMWNGAYEMEVVKGDSTDGDVEVMCGRRRGVRVTQIWERGRDC